MSDTGQVTSTAAEIYDEFFVPALFSAWVPQLVEAAALEPGMRAVDVACGTGAFAIEAAKVASPGGTVAGIDLNPGMLAVARRKAPELDWRQAPAESLPFEPNSFDAVVSQFGLMFFDDKPAAIAEMWRVLRPGGRLVLAVWASLERSRGYATLESLIRRLFGASAAASLSAPFALGEPEALEALLAAAGVADAQIQHAFAEARFPSLRAWMHTEIRGWTLADQIDDAQFETLVREAERELDPFVMPDGTVRFEQPALITSARKP